MIHLLLIATYVVAALAGALVGGAALLGAAALTGALLVRCAVRHTQAAAETVADVPLPAAS